jgi:branched-chain amino acid transport system ATP-binding protein
LSVLEIRRLAKAFGGLRAVQDFNVAVEAGEIHALIGPNGAGKSTVFNLICGLIRPDSGEVFLKDENITGLPPHRVAQKGVGRTFQNVRLFKNIPVRENVAVAINAERRTGILDSILKGGPSSAYLRSIHGDASQLLDMMELGHRADSVPKSLPYGEQKRLELARAMACKPQVLLLDEPTTGMNPSEAVTMIQTIESIRQTGVTILLVEHNMRVVMGISDTITVMDFGQVIAEGPPEQVSREERVIEAYLGEQRNAGLA